MKILPFLHYIHATGDLPFVAYINCLAMRYDCSTPTGRDEDSSSTGVALAVIEDEAIEYSNGADKAEFGKSTSCCSQSQTTARDCIELSRYSSHAARSRFSASSLPDILESQGERHQGLSSSRRKGLSSMPEGIDAPSSPVDPLTLQRCRHCWSSVCTFATATLSLARVRLQTSSNSWKVRSRARCSRQSLSRAASL